MSQKSYVLLVPEPQVTPLNFRKWLYAELESYGFLSHEPKKLVVAVTSRFLGSPGSKKFDKIVEKATDKHSWIGQVVTLKSDSLPDRAVIEKELEAESYFLQEARKTVLFGLTEKGVAISRYDAYEPVGILKKVWGFELTEGAVPPGLCEGQWYMEQHHSSDKVIHGPYENEEEARADLETKLGIKTWWTLEQMQSVGAFL